MKKYMLYVITLFFLGTSCVGELDNYDMPDGGVYGTIMDESTGAAIPLPVEGSTGLQVRIMEMDTTATQPTDIYAKKDGTYCMSTLFNGDYKITVDGPFLEAGYAEVSVKGQTKCDIKVTPLSKIDATASIAGKIATIAYTVIPHEGITISNVWCYWNFAPGVDNNNANKVSTLGSKNLAGTFTFDLTNDKTLQDNAYKIKSNGNKIYVRVGAEVKGKINYSEIIPLVVQW